MTLRTKAARALGGRRMGALLRRLGSWRGLLTICHHRIGDSAAQPFDRELWSASPEQLDAELAELARCVELVDPSELDEALGRARGRRALITFDDGYRDNHDVALEVLSAHGVKAAFFVATGFLDSPRVPWWDEIAWMVRRSRVPTLDLRPYLPEPLRLDSEPERDYAIAAAIATYKRLPADECERLLDALANRSGSGRCGPAEAEGMWMTWEMVRALRAAGMTIGGHTVDHPVLARLDSDAQRREIAGCAERLAEALGEPPRLFSYPVGLTDSYDATTKRLVAEQGFTHAFSLHGGWTRPGWDDPFDLPRTSAAWGGDLSRLRVTATLPQAFARY